jgi:hypothetical protein
MLAVTANAKERLRDILLELKPKESDFSLLRVEKQSSDSEKIVIILDTERKEDNVIMDNEGDKLLLIGPDLNPSFAGMILDHTETDNGKNFIISEV